MDGLPEYMQAHYKEILNLYDAIGNDLATKGRSYRLTYAKEAVSVVGAFYMHPTQISFFLGTQCSCSCSISQMKKQAKWYFHEAKWFHTGYTPTLEEYIPLALLTTGYEALSITSLVGMGDVVTRDAFEWLLGDCKILRASQIICRFMDDISSHKV